MSLREESFRELERDLAERSQWLVFIECTISAIILLTAFFGNILVFWVAYKSNILRQSGNYFIISLALSDVCMACLVMPFSFGVFVLGDWSYGFDVCQFQGILCVALGGVSLLTITLTAINRCIKMTRTSSQYAKMFTKVKTAVLLLLSWVCGWIIPASNLLLGKKFKFHPGKTICYFNFNSTPRLYSILMFNVFLISPFVIIIICYLKIYKTVRSHTNQIAMAFSLARVRTSYEEIKITKILSAIVFGFAICWMPFVVIDFASVFKGDYAFHRQVYVLYIFFVSSSSCINPIIYGVKNRQFRVALMKTLSMDHLFRRKVPKLRTKSVMTGHNKRLQTRNHHLHQSDHHQNDTFPKEQNQMENIQLEAVVNSSI